MIVTMLAAVLSFAASPAAAATYGDRAGFSPGYETLVLRDDPPRHGELTDAMEDMASTGARWIRIDLDWSVMQQDAPDTTCSNIRWDGSDPDRIVTAARDAGLNVLLVVGYTPKWANGGHTDNKYEPAEGFGDDYGDFVYCAGRHFIPKGVTAWELWNEPNIKPFWKPAPNQAHYISRVLVPGSKGIRQAASELGTPVTVVTGSTAPAASPFSPPEWVEGLYKDTSLRPTFDHIGHHPYSFPNAPTDGWQAFTQSDHMYATMRANGDHAKQIWATEIGWPTCVVDPENKCVDEATQYQRVGEAYTHWYARTFAGPLFWYSYRDQQPETDTPAWWETMGVLRRDGTRKQAYSALKWWNERLTPYQYEVRRDTPLRYWRLNEASGTFADDDRLVTGGTYANGVTLGAPGVFSSDPAARFDGVDDEVTINGGDAALMLNGTFTVEFAAKLVSASGHTWPGILGRGSARSGAGGWFIYHKVNGNYLAFGRNGMECRTTLGTFSTTPRHYAITYDGEKLRWYVDGAWNASCPATFPSSSLWAPFTIGRSVDEAGNNVIDEVAVYGYRVRGARIAAHYDARARS